MDFKNMREITEATKIHEELFQKSLYHDYYNLGVAHGLFFIYSMFNQFQENNFKGTEIMDVLKNSTGAYEDGKIKEYFYRMINDLDKK